jgi:hypothetical protein
MVKTPPTRHSKSRREPVTIELGPEAVSRITDEKAAGARGQDAAPEPEAELETAGEKDMRAEQADFEPWERDESAAEAAVDPQNPASAVADDDISPKSARPDREPVDSEGEGDASRAAFESAPPESPPEAAARPAAQPSRRGPNAIVAGLAGAVIALLGAGALQYAGVLGAPGSSALADLQGTVASLKGQMASLAQPQNNGDVTARISSLSDSLDKMKADVAALKSNMQADTGDEQAAAKLSDKVTAIENAVSVLQQQQDKAAADLGPLKDRIGSLDAAVKSQGEAAAKQEARLTAVEQSVAQLSGKVEAAASQPKIALAIAASALKSAFERGTPFKAELETFAAVSPHAPQLAALRAYAAKGVPTPAEIAAGMDEAANAMVAAASPEDPKAGFFQRLADSARSLVKVRPVGAVPGKGVPETVARMEADVKAGDYAKALSEYGTLPEPVKAAGAAFTAGLKARLAAQADIDALVADAMKTQG